MNRAKLMSLAGYTSFFWFWFALFAYWTFPYDRVAAFLTDKIDHSDYGYSLEIGSLSPYWLTGVELEDVKLRRTAAVTIPSVAGEPAKDDAFKIREARARLGLLSLLIGDRAVSFDAELDQGAIEGVYEESGDTKHVDATLSKVDLGKLGILDSVISLPVKGDVGGDFDLTLGKEAAKSTGQVKLQIRGLAIGDGKAKLKLGAMGGLTIDTIEAGTVTMELDVKDGVGTVKKLSTDGKDLELEGSGEVRLADPISRSRVDILLRVKFTDAYKNKSSRTKAVFGLLETGSVPQVRAAKTPDGALQFRLLGTLGAVRAAPAGRSGEPGAARAKKPRRELKPEGDEGDDEP